MQNTCRTQTKTHSNMGKHMCYVEDTSIVLTFPKCQLLHLHQLKMFQVQHHKLTQCVCRCGTIQQRQHHEHCVLACHWCIWWFGEIQHVCIAGFRVAPAPCPCAPFSGAWRPCICCNEKDVQHHAKGIQKHWSLDHQQSNGNTELGLCIPIGNMQLREPPQPPQG